MQDPNRRAAQYRLEQLAAQDADPDELGGDGEDDDAVAGPAAAPGTHAPGPAASSGTSDDAADEGPSPRTMAARATYVDELVRQAMARGEFDDLPLSGKPIPGLGTRHDPDWWLKAFIEREQISGVLPEALQLRKDDADLDDRLDGEHLEDRVREVVAEFNARVVEARRQLLGGPPVVTPTR